MGSSLGRSVSFGPFRLYATARVLEKDGVRLALGSRALDILIVLSEVAGRVVGHRELTQRVWRDLVVTPGSLRVHIAALRKALGESEGEVRYIANVPGQGYCFVAPVDRSEFHGSPIAADAHAGPSAALSRHNLPGQLTSFIGREKEIAQVEDLLASRRLIALTGAGGCGKTRLALQVAAAVVGDFPDGCWLVELAPLGDSALVAQAVANTFGVKEQAGLPLAEALAKHLTTRKALLVLDNAEHVIEACADLAELLLRRCPKLKLLATTREPLGVSGELTYRVPSLSVPEVDATTRESVLACEAAQLFVERVCLHRPAFDVTPQNARTLASICRRLDGIALAIELAAPRLRTMSIDELDRHLDDRFGFLTVGHRTAQPRHRTLRSLIDWSHDLLTPDEKAMLRRVAVFAGGWTVESAEVVCAGDSIARSAVLQLLTSLTDKSLLMAEPCEDATRFGMLETVRQYAWERLRESGSEEEIRARHLAFFLAQAEQLDEPQSDTERKARLSRMDVDHDNLRAALAWCESNAAYSAAGLRLAGKLDWFWRIRGHFGEGRSWIGRLLAASPGAGTEDHALAHLAAGTLAYHQGDYRLAEESHREALAIFQQLGDRRRAARSLGNLGNVALQLDNNAMARVHYEQALAIAREIDDRRSVALGLNCLGLLASESGDHSAAQEFLEEGISIAREIGDWSAAAMLRLLGLVKHDQGDLSTAQRLLTDSVNAEREFGNKVGLALALISLAEVLLDSGDSAAAKTRLCAALAIQQANNEYVVMSNLLEGFACLAAEIADPRLSARLFGRSEHFREEMSGKAVRSLSILRRERYVTAARTSLQDNVAFDQAWNEGRSMQLDEAVRCMLQV